MREVRYKLCARYKKERKERTQRKEERKGDKDAGMRQGDMRQAERPTGFEPTLALKIGYALVMRRVLKSGEVS